MSQTPSKLNNLRTTTLTNLATGNPTDAGLSFARSNVLAYAIGMNPTYEAAYHLKLLAKKLHELEQRKIRRLMVFMPPRHGKSFLVSTMFPTWYLGRHPSHRVIFTSYSDEIATDFGRANLELMRSPAYQAVFPGVSLSVDSKSKSRFHTRQGGVFYAVGAAGTLTGRGGDLIIIDDPHKNRDEANSPPVLERIRKWFGSTLYTRLMSNGIIIVVQTRWNEDDLAGHILKKLYPKGGWDVLSLPAIKEPIKTDSPLYNPYDRREVGEALWPQFFNIPTLKDIKTVVGYADWSALYQQRPTAIEGGIIKTKWLTNFFTTPPSKFDEMIISADFSFKGDVDNDYNVIGVWGRLGADRYLLDLWRKQAEFTEAKTALESIAGKWPKARAKIIEEKANGAAIISALKKTVSGLIPFNPNSSKAARLSAVAPEFEAGNIWLPNPSSTPWVHDYINELTMFPNGVNDDQVDMTSQALIRLSQTESYLKKMNQM